MHAERDYLISHVFPVIRRACRERQVEFTEIDLRWVGNQRRSRTRQSGAYLS